MCFLLPRFAPAAASTAQHGAASPDRVQQQQRGAAPPASGDWQAGAGLSQQLAQALPTLCVAEERDDGSAYSSCAVTTVDGSSEASGSTGSNGSAGSQGGNTAADAATRKWVVERYGSGPDLEVDLYEYREVGLTGGVLAEGRHGKVLQVRSGSARVLMPVCCCCHAPHGTPSCPHSLLKSYQQPGQPRFAATAPRLSPVVLVASICAVAESRSTPNPAHTLGDELRLLDSAAQDHC